MYLSYKFRLRPTDEQLTQLKQHAGTCRYVWNHMLAANIAKYESEGKFIFRFEMQKLLVGMKKQEELSWLKDVNSQSEQVAIMQLDTALRGAFKSATNRKGFPKFKSKRDRASFHVPQHFEITNKTIKLPKIGHIKYNKHRQLLGTPKSLTISCDVDQWFVSILCELPDVAPILEIKSQVGIDLGLKDFAVTSDAEIINDKLIDEELRKKLKQAQRELTRKQKGSNRRNKARSVVAKLHRKIRRKRADFLHKSSSSIAKNYDLVCLEDLNIKGMMKNHKLARSIGQQGWGEFVRQLEYKMARKGGHVQFISRWFASTKTCSCCGWLQEMPLDQRTYQCGGCGVEISRDINAARNILVEGNRLFGLGTSPVIRGGSISPGSPGDELLKREATEPSGSW